MGRDLSTTLSPSRPVRPAAPHSFISFTSSISFTSCCFRTLLSFFAFPENSILFFSYSSALFHKNEGGRISSKTLFPDRKFFRIRISQNRGPK
jgi:hypothetical protein